MKTAVASPSTAAVFSANSRIEHGQTGPSFAAALCGFLGTTVATTMVMVLLNAF